MSEPFWWRLHFGGDSYVPDDRRAQLTSRLAEWCKSGGVQTGAGTGTRPGAEQLRRGWRGLNTASTSAPKLTLTKIRTCASRLANALSPDAASGRRNYAVHFDYSELLASVQAFDSHVACEVNAALTYQPDEALNCIGAAVCDAVFGGSSAAGGVRKLAARVTIRLANIGEEFRLSIGAIRAHSVGKIVGFVGVVVKVGPPRAIAEAMEFRCAKCGELTPAEMLDGRFDPPMRCGAGGGCRGRTMLPVRKSVVCVDWQRIRVQEQQGGNAGLNGHSSGGRPGDGITGDGRLPCSIDCELREGLIERCAAGETVRITGLVKTASNDSHGAASSSSKHGGGGKAGNGTGSANMYSLYIDVVSIDAAGGAANAASGDDEKASVFGDAAGEGICEDDSVGVDARSSAPPSSTKFSEMDLKFIAKFAQEHDGDQLRQLVHSLCPGILGHEMIKTGMLLAMVGGVQKNAGVKSRIQVRGDIHMLVVGDPGLGKSQMLKAVQEASPRGVYVCGNGTTAAGLTASVGRDADIGGGGYHFEAGALVLADRGVCCVDEFDKLTADHHSLLEAMEQQTVSLAKAGLTASLPSRAAVIAAANPVKGRYDRSRTVNENIKLSNAMMSRFDLVFVLLDEPDERADRHLSEHLLALHSGNVDRTKRAQQNLLGYGRRDSHLLENGSPRPSSGVVSPLTNRRSKLDERIKLRPGESFYPLPKNLIRVYIAYVRRYVFPTLSDDAKAVLKDFYLELRTSARPADGTPITVRVLRSQFNTMTIDAHARDFFFLSSSSSSFYVLSVCAFD